MNQGSRSFFTGMKQLAVVLGAIFVISGCGAAKIEHSKVVDAMFPVQPAADITKIGLVTSVKELNGTLYIGAQEGLGAMDSTGKVLWTLSLPYAGWRLIDADAESVAFTSYNITGQTKEKVLFIPVGHSVNVSEGTVGLATSKGTLVWSVESAEPSLISPPALGKSRIGVMSSVNFVSYDRADGKVVHQVKVGGLFKSIANASGVLRPVAIEDVFYVGHDTKFAVIDEQGKAKSKVAFGLFAPITEVTAGPVIFKDKLLFTGTGNTGGSGAQVWPRVFATNAKIGAVWSEKIKANESCGYNRMCYYFANAIATNSNTVYVATKYTLSAYSEKGAGKWTRWTKNGGLNAGSHRFVGSPGAQLLATDKNVYVTSTYKGADALTVLDADSGDYVQSIDVKAKVIDMAKLGENLVLATNEGVKFISLK